jgi:hypothetical protein
MSERKRVRGQNAKYSLNPVQVDSSTWFYEEPKGLLIVRQCRNLDGEYIQTEQFTIPWRKLISSVDRHKATRRKLSDLIERVEKATGPDREIDYEIARTIEGYANAPTDLEGIQAADHGAGIWPDGGQPGRYTASLDAAIALVERVLPDANCYGVEKDPRSWIAHVSRNQVDSGHWLKEAEHKTAPLALLSALLRALSIKETE